MEIGKIPESVLKRSVISQIKVHREEVLIGAGIGEDCAALRLAPDEVFVVSTDPITGTTQQIGSLSIHIVANDLAASGAEPIAVLLTILLPKDSEEVTLKQMMREVNDACEGLSIEVVGGHTEVTEAVNQPIVSITGIGKIKADSLITAANAKPGQDIVITKWIGLEGTAILAKEREHDLLQKLPRHMIETSKGFFQYISVVPESKIAMNCGVSAMHDITEGGIFGALWEMAEASRIGLEIDLKKIPVRQETIEICEFFRINPYGLVSSGSMLLATDHGRDLVRAFEKAAIPAVVVGKALAGNDRVLLNDGERRFLEPPKTDALYLVGN